jgi:hypothetical protein
MILKVDAEQRIIYISQPTSLNELLDQIDLIDITLEDWLIQPESGLKFSLS